MLALHVITGILYATTAPLLDVSDEPRHYAYVEHLAHGGALPVQRAGQTEIEAPWLQEGSQPPLYYALMAVVAQPFDRSDYAQVWRFNPHARLGRADATHNWNQMLHSDAERFPWRGTMRAMMAMRFIGVLLGAFSVACVYFFALELRPGDTALALFSAGLTAFNPMFLHIMGSVNNDTLATATSSLALLLGARLIRRAFDPSQNRGPHSRGAESRLALALGCALGCAALSKASGLALAGVVPLAVLLAQRLAGRPWRALFAQALAIAIPALLIAGWFYARNAALYGEPTGTRMMALIAGARAVPFDLAGEWRSFLTAYIGMFGALNIPMSGWVYSLYEALLALSAAGLLLILRDQFTRDTGRRSRVLRRPAPWITWMAMGSALVAMLALLRWTALTLASQGRLLFPTIVALSTLQALGLLRIFALLRAPALGRALPGMIMGALAALSLLAPFVYMRPAYAEPARLANEDQLPADIVRSELRFSGAVRWIGYRVNPPGARLTPGGLLDLTLYWQGLTPMTRDYSVFIKLYGRGGAELLTIDTYPGGGMFQTTRWQAGEIIADRYRIRLPSTISSILPGVLLLDVGMYDFSLGTSAGQLATFDGTGAPTTRQRYEVASIGAPGRVTDTPDLYTLERAAVTRAATEVTPDSVRFDLDWRVSADFSEDFTTFVQLFDAAGTPLGQGDGRAFGSGFAPRWWRAGDAMTGDRYTIALKQPLAPGRYIIRYGLYRPGGDHGRMAARDAQGQPVADAVLIHTFDVP